MAAPVDICSLDYLVGTLATAYKGIITSLVAKDFCMTELYGDVTLKGTILAMPEGAYQVCLMREGNELSRTDLKKGRFEFTAGKALIEKAGNLQIDIIQGGRHIGTFLLKKEAGSGFFTSAMEIAGDLRGVNFAALTAAVRDRPGMLARAESIIGKVLSTKKDWRALSGEISGFAADLFWYDREAHERWFGLMVRASVSACEKLVITGRDKSVSNVLALLEPVLENESDRARLRSAAGTWLQEVQASAVPLTYHVKDAVRLLSACHERLPDFGIIPFTRMLVDAVRTRIAAMPAVDDSLFDHLRGVVPVDDLRQIGQYGKTRKGRLSAALDAAQSLLEQRRIDGLLKQLTELDEGLPDETRFADLMLETIEKNLESGPTRPLSDALLAVLAVLPQLPPAASERASASVARIIGKLARAGRSDLCERFLSSIAEGPPAVLEDILLDAGVAASLLNTGKAGLRARYLDLVKIVVPSPGISGFSNETWAETANPGHLRLLSKFLSLLHVDAAGMETILARVVCNLYLSGVFIPDDRLFQREVSAFLNAGTARRHFLLGLLLLKKLPVFFNEVGATGMIRDDSTEIDSWGNDQVLYFLRKQVHVNASNYNIRLIEAVMESWAYDDPGRLAGTVPEDVMDNVDRPLFARYHEAMLPLLTSLKAVDAEGFHPERLIAVPEQEIIARIGEKDLPEEIRKKTFLLLRLYREVVGKYSPATTGVRAEDPFGELTTAINRLAALRRTITSPEPTEAEESLYFKRHIAFGIPSVLGSYHEAKFDALSALFRLDARISVLLEQIIVEMGKQGIVSKENDGKQWVDCLAAVHKLLTLHGHGNFQVDELVIILQTGSLRPSQAADLLRAWQKELTWMVETFSRTIHTPLADLLAVFPHDDLPEHLRGLDRRQGEFIPKATDIIIRDLLNDVPGLTELDRLLAVLITALGPLGAGGRDEAPALYAVAQKGKEVYVLDELTDREAMTVAPLIGGKAKNLVYLRNAGLLVPHAVLFRADRTSDCDAYTESDEFKSALKTAVRELEARTGRLFGRNEKPLFLSVRSGSYLSMPGILSTVLYCGMNSVTRAAFLRERNDPRLAWDSHRRFIEHYASVVLGLDLRVFQDIVQSFMREYELPEREGLDAKHMEEITARHLKELSVRGLAIPDDGYEQLRQSVKSVYRSWHGPRAIQFRKAMKVSDYWGTAVMLMEMVPANGAGGGASVFFTRKPGNGNVAAYGETREMATGDDLVSGTLTNRPLRRDQGGDDRTSLEESDSALFTLHQEIAEKIEQAMGSLPQEVEAAYVTTADGQRVIYALQARRMESLRGFTRRFDDVCRMEENIVGRGIGVHGGALSGVASFAASRDAVRALREQSGMPVILLRRTAGTDDVTLMGELGGLITAAGGVTSHAAVLASKFGLAAVVGCPDLKIHADRDGSETALIGTHAVQEGDLISMDGSTGLLYAGTCMPAPASS